MTKRDARGRGNQADLTARYLKPAGFEPTGRLETAASGGIFIPFGTAGYALFKPPADSVDEGSSESRRIFLEAVMNWVERGEAPSMLTGLRSFPDGTTRTRPLCPYPDVAVWNGVGSTDVASNFTCGASR